MGSIPIIFAALTLLTVGATAMTHRVPAGTSIAAAVERAAAGDTVLIQAGRHRANAVYISVPMNVIGERGAIVDGGRGTNIFIAKTDGVSFSNLVLENVGVSHLHENAAIRFEYANNGRVANCTFNDTFFGVYLSRSHYVTVHNNRFNGAYRGEAFSGNGVHQWSCTNITVTKNIIRGHRDGVYLEFSRHGVIRDNLSENNSRYGLHFMFSDSCLYQGNTFRENGAGVAVMYTKWVTMRGNTFADNWGSAAYGLLLKEITDSYVAENTFGHNTTGLYEESCNRITIERNWFESNGYAMRLMADCQLNTVQDNIFSGNSFNVSTNGRSESNTFRRNYWSDYSGYDLDRDGFGDVPHHPVRLFTFVAEQHTASLMLLRSLFTDLLDLTERALPSVTPQELMDRQPRMKPPTAGANL
jgi:nitrous oxidase accessory protein